MKHKLFRTLIAFCLILVLVVNVSPLRVQAMSAGGLLSGAVLSLPASWVVGALVVGLGIVAVNSSTFQGYVTSITDCLTYDGCVVDGMIDVGRFTGVNGQEAIYGVPQDVVSDVFDAMYETGAVNYSEVTVPVLTADSWFAGGLGNLDFKASVDVNVLARYYGASSSYFYIYAFEPFSYHVTGLHYVSDGTINSYESKPFTYSGTTFYYGSISREDLGSYEGPMLPNTNVSTLAKFVVGELTFDDSGSISVADGLGAAQIAPQGSDLAVGYPQWVANTINYNIEGQSIPYLPVGLGATYEDTIAKTQEEIWAGTSEYQVEVLGNWDILLNGISAVKSRLGSVVSTVLSIFEVVQAGFDNVVSTIASIPEFLSGCFTDVITAIQAIPGALAISWETVIGIGRDILDNVTSIPIAIAEAIAAVLVDALTWAFAISDTFIQTKVEALTLKYPYLETFHILGANLKNFFLGLGSRPPVIYIHLDAATGSIYWGGSQLFLDLSWYAAYKPTMDAILGGFLWLAVAWRTYLHLPGLISGATGVIGAFGSYNRAAEAESKRRRDDP